MLSNLLQIQDGFIEEITPLFITDTVVAQIETLKLQLRSMRSPGRKLDGLRGVIQRCEKCQAQAMLELEEAEALMKEAKGRYDSETIAL